MTLANDKNPLNATSKFANTISPPNTNNNLNSAQGAGVDSKAFKFMNDMLKDHDNRLEQILDMLDDKVDKNWVEAMISNKVGKEEVTELLPDMSLHDQKVATMIESNIDDLWVKLEQKFMAWDQRMTTIR